MRQILSLSLSLTLAGSLSAAANDPPLGRPVIEQVQQTAGSIYDGLKSFVCDEHISRFRGAPDGSHAKPVDAITAALSFENGTEQYRDIYQNAERKDSMASIRGAWSEGEFGSLLRQTAELLETQPVHYTGTSDENGVLVTTYSFDTASEVSPWELVIDTRSYRVAFRTDISVAAESGQVVRISRRALALAPETGISEIDWSVALTRTRLQGSEWVLPASAEYSVSYGPRKRREWNHITFDHYRRYAAEVAIRFDGQ